MAIKKVLLQKKIEGTLFDIYQKTSADIVEYNGTTVAAQLATLASDLENISKDDGTIDAKIKTASDSLYNKIMGFTDSDTTINQAYDTLKEVADYLTAHGNVVDGFTADIAALKKAVGDADSGLVKDVADLKTTTADHTTKIRELYNTLDDYNNRINNADLKISSLETTVGDDTKGLVKQVADNKKAIETLEAASTKVVKSSKNGYVTVDGADVLVYDDSAIAATKIVEDDTHKFCTAAEKEAYAAAAKVVVATEAPATLDEKDLLMLVIG